MKIREQIFASAAFGLREGGSGRSWERQKPQRPRPQNGDDKLRTLRHGGSRKSRDAGSHRPDRRLASNGRPGCRPRAVHSSHQHAPPRSSHQTNVSVPDTVSPDLPVPPALTE